MTQTQSRTASTLTEMTFSVIKHNSGINELSGKSAVARRVSVKRNPLVTAPQSHSHIEQNEK